MTPRPRYARLAAEVLAKEPFDPSPPSDAERDAAIAVIAATSARLRRKRRARRVALAVASVTALAAAALLAVRAPRSGPSAANVSPPAASAPSTTMSASAVEGTVDVAQSGVSERMAAGARVDVGASILVKASSRVELSLSTGTTVTADANASLAVLESGRSTIFRLETGVLHAKVAKLHGDERFVVRTLDAEIEVRGTAFRLESGAPAADCAAGTHTRLTVTEGVVAVRGGGEEALVRAGESWPSCLAPAATSAKASHDRPPPPAPSVAHAASSLGAENDLFTRAMAAKRDGDSAGALRAFELFLSRYPSSPLRENATVERMGLLRRTGSPAQIAAARDYLARYPNGFARREAEKIVAPGD